MTKAIALVGPTAVGKTALSLRIAELFSCEIISVDSMQVYRHMDIGTAKATPDERAMVPHHLIDIVNPDEEYNLARFIQDATGAASNISQRVKNPLLVGGTGLYLRGISEGIFEMGQVESEVRNRLKDRLAQEGRDALHRELAAQDPEAAARIHANDTQRLLRALEIVETTGKSWSAHIAGQKGKGSLDFAIKIGLICDREELYQRINRRVQMMIEEGLVDEVQKLLDMGYSSTLNSMQSIGYRHIANYLEGRWDFEEAIQLLARDTRRYAKRQLTWFRKDPAIQWYAPDESDRIVAAIERSLTT